MGSCELPPGFRFHPTDEELIVHYLQNQATSRRCPVSIIPELNIYKFDPWELPAGMASLGEGEWYFFSPRDRKYPNGARPNRATVSGYWKATGTDKAIYSKSRYVGVKKALVFYKGRPPRGIKTDWIMHEYRLGSASPPSLKLSGSSSMRLDDWVLCRIYQKKQQKRVVEDGGADEVYPTPSFAAQMAPVAAAKTGLQVEQQTPPPPPPPQQQQQARFPRSCSLAHLLEAAEYMPLSQMLGEYSADAGDNFHAMAIDFGGGSGGGAVEWDVYAAEKGKSRGAPPSSTALLNHPNLVVGPSIFHC